MDPIFHKHAIARGTCIILLQEECLNNEDGCGLVGVWWMGFFFLF